MRDTLRHFLRVALVLLLAPAIPVSGQDVQFQTVDERADGLVVEIRVTWPLTLRAALDSSGASHFDFSAARALSNGVVLVAESYALPSFSAPNVRLIEADYDEIALPPASGADELIAELRGEPVEAVGLGMVRKEPVVNLQAKLLGYDPDRRQVRRYRRMVVALEYESAAAKQTLSWNIEPAVHNPHLDVTRSVLADGAVYKIPITREGIYRIDRAFIAGLQGLGISPDNIDPDRIKIYGNGGAPVPALNGAPRIADLAENPAHSVGGGDGAFNAGDAVYFYAAAPSGWTYNASSRSWEHYVNPFSRENYYFIKIGDASPALRVGDGTYPDFPDAQPRSQVTGRYFRDTDEFMWSKESGSGLTWVSRTLRSGNSRKFLDNLRLPGLQAGEVQYRARVAIRSNPMASVFFHSGTTQLAELKASMNVGQGETEPVAASTERSFVQNVAAGAALDLTMRVEDRSTNPPEAALEWIRVFYLQALAAQSDTLRFATPSGESGRFEFTLSGFSQAPHVWDVTDPAGIYRLATRVSGGAYRVQVEVTDVAQPREIIAFTVASARTLESSLARPVANQNLHGIEDYPDFVIVTPEPFRASAEQLAERRRREGLRVEVVDIRAIFNEFSGGLQDMRAARDYFKFLYDRAPDDARRLRLALFYGDGHFNFRELGDDLQKPTLTNWIPPYQTDESFHPIRTYTSDDYFGLLDDHEGEWRLGFGQSDPGPVVEKVDIGIGRLTVQTPEEAAAVLRKIERYEDPATYGPWRGRYMFLADDALTGISGTKDEGDLHTQNSDVVAELVKREYPSINLRKIYGISYSREFINGWRQPGVRRDLHAALNEGVLLFNYSGHGGKEALAQEEYFTRADAEAMDNFDRLPIFMTATCSFGWWDLGRDQSTAEVLLLNERGGAVALMTTVRVVYTSRDLNTLNVGLNRALNTEMFKRDEQGLPRRLGDILRSTKNTTPGVESNNRKFNLLGDPSMRLGLPTHQTAVEEVNGKPIAERPQLRALDKITIAGSVRGTDGNLDGQFSGRVQVTVYDAERQVTIPPESRSAMPTPYYLVRDDLIWRGIVPAENGRFSATFVVPKDISYTNKTGRISAYAEASDRHALGFTHDVVVGGTAENPTPDNEGPEITLFLNDTTFVSGGLTPPEPRLIVRLYDETGINTVGAGVGHELLLTVNGNEQQTIDLSDRFETEENSYQRGRVQFSFRDYPVALGPGPQTLTVRAWDVANNSSIESLDFYVAEDADLVLRNVYNYPNPTSGRTRFLFEHNQPVGTTADVQIRIYTLNGRPIRTLATEEALPAGILPGGPVQVMWDGLDEDFGPIASGVYLYKVRVSVESADGERRVAERIEKLAIIR